MPEQVVSVFLSHADEDAPCARQFCARLEELGCRVWLDERELWTGDVLVERISDAVDWSDFFVSLVSTHSVDSIWCRKELALAMSGEIERDTVFVLPVRMDDTSMPGMLKDKLYLDVRRMDPRRAADKVVESIHEHVARTRALPARRPRPLNEGLLNPVLSPVTSPAELHPSIYLPYN